MHAFGMIILWTAVQVTVIATVIFLVLPFAKKSEPLWRTQIILAGIAAVFFVSACGISPWPNWSQMWDTHQIVNDEKTSSENEVSVSASQVTLAETEIHNAAPLKPTPTEWNGEEPISAWSAAWTEFLAQVKKPRPIASKETQEVSQEEPPAFTVSSVIGVLFLIGLGFSLVRLITGIWLLRREILRSPLVHNERLRRIIGQILGESSKDFSVEVRVSSQLKSAATTGILHPVILLPTCWTTWSDEDLQAVLAHELNHIFRKDCLSTLCAEFARVLHFYHPLMHWLASRLRLEQELAADAHAAQVLGGQKRYLCILAEMALSESGRVPAWPARAFLPSHRTLIRRIEMLRKSPTTERRVSRFWRIATMACLGLATVFAVGLRDQPGKATAQEPDNPNPLVIAQADLPAEEGDKTADIQPFSLTYVPDEAIAVFGVRPKVLLGKASLQPLTQILLKSEETSKPFGIPLDQVEQVVWSLGAEDTPRHPPMLIAAMIRTSNKLDLESLKEKLLTEPDTGFYGGQLYLRDRRSSNRGSAFWLADEHTLIISDSESGLKQAIDARNLSVNREKRIAEWNDVAQQPFASYANIGLLRRLIEGPGPGLNAGFGGLGPRGATPQGAFQRSMGLNPMFGPLWNDIETVVGSLTFDQDIRAELTTQTKDAEGALKVKQTLDALLVLGRNMVEQNQQMIGQLPPGEREMIGMFLKMSQEVMKTIQIKRGPKDVVVTAHLSPKAVDQLVTALVPAVTTAQDAARRAQSQNNLKQLGLAMHNYHDTHREFPRPVMMGPDGKTPHSWRVAILPYVDEQALYEQYRFDEPWDSDHNKKLIEKIPEVFRHPKDKPNSTNTSYFALTGEKTLLGDSKRNTGFADITDGTSNTLMLVEAKRDIPWTKPEDIPYNGRSKPLPKLGGWFKEGFVTLFGDGSVHFVMHTIDKTLLQNLIERNDNQVVNFEEFTDRPRNRGRRRGTGSAPADVFRDTEAQPATDEAESQFDPNEGGESAIGGSDSSGESPILE